MCTIAMLIFVLFHPPGERVFSIVSTSMAPTFLIGDYVVAVPYAGGRAPARGDIVAFRSPGDDVTIFTFRIIGLPGDRVQMDAGRVVLNGVAVDREPAGEATVDTGYGDPLVASVFRETLPGGVAYDTLDSDPEGFLDTTPVFSVPPGSYFLLGDNRDNAADSRLADRVGYVPEGDIVGRIDTVLCARPPDGSFPPGRTGLRVGG